MEYDSRPKSVIEELLDIDADQQISEAARREREHEQDLTPAQMMRSSGIGCYPPPQPGTMDLAEPGMFVSEDAKVINWNGVEYYKSCDALVYTYPEGNPEGHHQSFCVKREGHRDFIHEDYAGRKKKQYDFSTMPINEAVYTAVGAASVCWENMSGTGVFDEARAHVIAEELLRVLLIFRGKND